jgi:hypothetical protein
MELESELAKEFAQGTIHRARAMPQKSRAPINRKQETDFFCLLLSALLLWERFDKWRRGGHDF